MAINIIRGGVSSGKSKLCLEQMSEIHKKSPDSKCILLVPDHYSYEAERMLVDYFGGIGLNNIEVMTPRRMCISLLSPKEQKKLTPSGKTMLIHKAVQKTCEELINIKGMDMKLITSMRRQGFLTVIDSLLSEMKRYMVTPELILDRANKLQNNQTLKNKLTALACILEKYTSYVEESGYYDSDDDLYRLAEHIERENFFNTHTYVWVNRFDKLMPHQLYLLEALLKKGVNMTVSICCPVTDNEFEREIYMQTEKTLSQVMKLSDIYGLGKEYTAGKSLSHLKEHNDLYKLFNSWTEDFICHETPLSMALFQSRDTYGEIERIACKIVDLVREENYHFDDIALLCGDENDYRHLIEAIFAEYEIPYFADRKIILSDHPIAMQVLSLFGILEDDWSYDTVFRYLRSGFIYRKSEKNNYCYPIKQQEIDTLENFVLKYGIRGTSIWLSDENWTNENDIIDAAFARTGDKNTENSKIDSLRREITEPIANFKARTRGKHSAEELAVALFNYLEEINLYNGLKSEIYNFKKNGMVNEAEQYTQIWNLILDVLNQVAVTLKYDELTLSEFAEYISIGLSKCEIRTIPSGIDQVYVGSVERTSHSGAKAIFVVGAKSGTFPTGIATEGFLSDHDRQSLANDYDLLLAPDTKKKLDEQQFKVYRALSSVSELLYFSYSAQDSSGRTLSPSHLINNITKKFPKIRKSDNILGDTLSDGVYISSPHATVHRLLINKSSHNDNPNELWNIVYNWYSNRPEWQKMLSLLKRADYYDNRGIMLDSDIAHMLYNGKITYSASRINAYTTCPFQYFLKYGLRAKERDVWDITPANLGTYAHEVINKLCLSVEDGAETGIEKIQSWRQLSDDRRNELLNNIIDETCNNMLSSNMHGKERTAAIFRRMGRTISDAAILVQKSLSAGNFAQNGMEYNFNIELSDSVSVKGIIDRIDVCQDQDKKYVRIVDYKTGKTNFNIVDIYNGYNMQMVIYALAAQDFLKNAEISGVYYTAVRDEMQKIGTKITEDNVDSVRRDKMYLDGVTFSNTDDESSTANLVYNIDNDFFKNSESTFTKIKLNKDNTISNVRSSDEINGLMEITKDKILDADKQTRNGDISMSPYPVSTQFNACVYCPYSSACCFDAEHCKQKNIDGVDKEFIWEIVKTKGAALKHKKEKGGEI